MSQLQRHRECPEGANEGDTWQASLQLDTFCPTLPTMGVHYKHPMCPNPRWEVSLETVERAVAKPGEKPAKEVLAFSVSF